MDQNESRVAFNNILSVALLIVEKIKTDRHLRELPPFEFVSAMAIIMSKMGMTIGLTEKDLQTMISASVAFSKDESVDMSNVIAFRK